MEKKILSPGAILIRQARALLIGATVLWGASFPLLRGLQLAQREHAPHVPDAAMACADTAMRFALAALFLLPFYGRGLLRVTWQEWSQALGLSFFAAFGLYLQTIGLAWTDASISAFLTQLYSLIVPLIVALRDRRFPSLRVIVACAMVLIGVALLSPGLLTHFILGPGELVIILSSGFMAAQIIWVERPIYTENRPGVVTLILFTVLAGIFIIGYPLTGGTAPFARQMFDTPALWTLMIALVLLCTIVNFFIMNAWQRCVSATEAGLIYCIEPVIATILSAFLPGWMSHFAAISYPNEMLSWTLLAGGALIITATILVATERRS